MLLSFYFLLQALEEVKDDTKLYTNRAQTYIKLGKYSEALEDCDWALRVGTLGYWITFFLAGPRSAIGRAPDS